MNNIQLKTEQKKEYVVPQMEIVEMNHDTSLLSGSPCVGYCDETT